MRNTLVSIITVCLNSSKSIRKTFDSVLQQDYSQIEYLVIDGLSTDGTVDIIKEYEPLFQGRMRWISEKDDGIYDAMNKGIRMSSGELIGILNSDDYYEKDAVKIMISEWTEERYQILYGAMRTWKDGVEESINLLSHRFLRERMIGHPACFVTRGVYEDFGYYDTEYISAADYDFMLKMNENSKVHFVPVYHLIVNFTAGGVCASDKAYEDLMEVRKAHGLLTKSQYRKFQMKRYIYKVMQFYQKVMRK